MLGLIWWGVSMSGCGLFGWVDFKFVGVFHLWFVWFCLWCGGLLYGRSD